MLPKNLLQDGFIDPLTNQFYFCQILNEFVNGANEIGNKEIRALSDKEKKLNKFCQCNKNCLSLKGVGKHTMWPTMAATTRL